MVIGNKAELSTTRRRQNALAILMAGLASIEPERLTQAAVKYNARLNSLDAMGKDYYLQKGRIFIAGAGKAAGHMAAAVEKIIGPGRITAGEISAPSGDYGLRTIRLNAAGHPLPDSRGVRGANRILALKEKYHIAAGDLVLCLWSGGGSAMLPAPPAGLSLKDKQSITGRLIRSGADIREINIVRKHLSRVKGGQLARHFAPARTVSLLISDVVGNDPAVIASGPTVPDPSTFRDAQAVLKKYELWKGAPAAVRRYLEAGLENLNQETPKDLPRADNYIIGKNTNALEAMAMAAKKAGYRPLIVTDELAGDPVSAVREVIGRLTADAGHDLLLFGGETTPRPPVRSGQGGRNLHMAALLLKAMAGRLNDWLVLTAATDGVDYLPAAAGAIVDPETVRTAAAKGIDIDKHLKTYDTYTLFARIGGSLIKTGPTGTNVGDVMMIMKNVR